MKYIFIINPCSGQKNKDELLNQIEKLKDKFEYEIYYTKKEGDAISYVDEYCKLHPEDTAFCACGGDGTLSEVVNGAINHSNAIVTCYPCGSGNDFVKVYGKEKFKNIENLINGVEVKIDVMEVNDRYSINVTNFGFDSKVCEVANKVRRKKIIGGKNSYRTGIIVALFKGRRNKCKIICDQELLIDKEVLLATIANGKYVGGAYLCAPKSINDDGLLEVTIVKPLSIFKFINLVKYYKEGKHLENPKFDKYLIYKRAKEVEIEAPKGFKICIDGEIYQGEHFIIKNHKQILRFIRPVI